MLAHLEYHDFQWKIHIHNLLAYLKSLTQTYVKPLNTILTQYTSYQNGEHRPKHIVFVIDIEMDNVPFLRRLICKYSGCKCKIYENTMKFDEFPY